MALSLYELSIPVFERVLKNLSHVLQKGEAHAEEHGIEAGVLTNARLYPDMYPLWKQVHIATELAARGAARLSGEEPPSLEDAERGFAELQSRIEQTLARLDTIEPKRMEGAEARKVTLEAGGKRHELTGLDYLMNFALPNLYFHTATAYDILRHNGVVLGKADYLGVRP